jgi:hypothetical protein
VISRLTDPAEYGGDPADAFDVVLPSLPGFGFSAALPAAGTACRIPELWNRLMTDVLGYDRYGAHDGDIGAMVTNRLAVEHPEALIGIHVTMPAEPHVDSSDLTEAERQYLDARNRRQETGGAYAHLHRTRPDTLAVALHDSPAGPAAWIVDKWWAWSDHGDDLETRFSKDHLLTTVSLYWVTETIGTSIQLYRDWALGSPGNRHAWLDKPTSRAASTAGRWPPVNASRCPPRSASSTTTHRCRGFDGPTPTCATMSGCPAADTSPRSRSPTCSSTTYGRSSAPFATGRSCATATPGVTATRTAGTVWHRPPRVRCECPGSAVRRCAARRSASQRPSARCPNAAPRRAGRVKCIDRRGRALRSPGRHRIHPRTMARPGGAGRSTTRTEAAKMCGWPAGVPPSVPVQAPGVWPPGIRSTCADHGATVRASWSARVPISDRPFTGSGHQSTPSCRIATTQRAPRARSCAAS